MKKLKTFLMAFIAMFMMVGTAFAEDYFEVVGKEPKYDEKQFSDALEAVEEGGTIKLLKDVTFDTTNFKIEKNIILDLNSKTMEFTGKTSNSYSGLVIRGHNLTVKNGTIKSSATSDDALVPAIIFASNGANIKLEDVDLTMSGNGTAITLYTFNKEASKVTTLDIDKDSTVSGTGDQSKATITNYCQNAQIDVYGTVKHSRTYSAINNASDGKANINIHDGAYIESSKSGGILHMGEGKVTVEGTIKGYSSGVTIINGSLEVKDGAEITATGGIGESDKNADGKVEDNGAAVFVAPDPNKNVVLDVTGGTLTSTTKAAISAVKDNSKLTISITGGTFTGNDEVGALNVKDKTNFVKGGVYSSNIASKNYVSEEDKMVSLNHNNDTNYYIGEDTNKVVALAQSGDVIDVLQGDFKPTESLGENVTVKNSGTGEVIVNETTIEKDKSYTTPIVNTGATGDKTILEGITYETEEDVVLEGTLVTETDDIFAAMVKEAESKGYTKILKMLDISVKDNKTFTNPITITFNLGSEYNGKTVYIIHRLHDESYQKAEETVKDGKVSITVKELSPFIIALKEEKAEEVNPNPTPNNAQTSSINILGYGVVGVASLGGLVILAKKRKENN